MSLPDGSILHHMLTMVLPYVKSLLLISSALLSFAALLPPRRASERTQKVYTGQPFEYTVRFLGYLACFVITSPSFAQSALLLLKDVVPNTGNVLCHTHPRQLAPLFKIPPRFLVGVLLVFSGALCRLWAYRALGTFFTFEVSIKYDHELITTGPYAFVRHPAYTGVVLILLGEQLVQFGFGGYVSYCGVAETPFGVFIHIWRYGSLFTVYSLYRRCSVEDGQLEERFGNAWRGYARRVRCKLLPCLL